MKNAIQVIPGSPSADSFLSSKADAQGAQEQKPAEDLNAVSLVESATWFLNILTILLSLLVGYLVWAKLTSIWPFPQ